MTQSSSSIPPNSLPPSSLPPSSIPPGSLPPTPPSPTPLEYQPQPRHSKFPALIAWVIVISCVAFVMYRVSRSYARAAEQGITNPSSELQVQFVGKTAMGLTAMPGATATTKSSTTQPANPNAEQMIDSMDQYASSPAEKVRTVTAVAELKGADAALKRID